MAYMHVCPKCRSFFKAKSTGKDLKCPKCSYQYLLDLKMDDEAWGTLNCDEKKIVIRARISEEGLAEVVASGSVEVKTAGVDTAQTGPVKKVVKKVVRKKVVRKTAVQKSATDGEALSAAKPTEKPDIPEDEIKAAAAETEEKKAAEDKKTSEDKKQGPEETPTGQSWETVFEAAEEREEKEAEIKEENKASSGAANILASFLKGGKDKKAEGDKESGDSSGESGEEAGAESENGDSEAAKEPVKPEKVKLNRKYVAIVAGSMGAIFLYLLIVTFVVPTFRIKSELSLLRTAETGDTVQFGKYKGRDDWTVLDRKGTKLLCISDYPIEGQVYYDEGWDNSSLRKWLNSVYINSSFNVFERRRLTSTEDIQEEFPDYSRDMGTDAPDKVFIISENELLDYLQAHREAAMNINDGEIRAVCWIETD